MPAPLPVDDVIKCRITGTKGPDSWGIHMYLHAGTVHGPYTISQMNDVANEVEQDFQLRMAPHITSDTALQKTVAEDLTTGGTAIGISSVPSVNGSDISLEMPSGVAAVVNFGIASRYRGGHPRVYLPPPGESSKSDARSWSTTYRSAVETAWNGMLSDIQASTIGTTLGLGQVAVRYHSAHAVLTPPEVFDVLLVTTSPIIASQRRRYNR